MKTTIVWVRRDLRIGDNAALDYAAGRGAVLPVFVWDPAADGDWLPGAASRVWLHHALRDLAAAYRAMGLRLLVCRGETIATLADVLRRSGADAVVWNRSYEPAAIATSTAVKSAVRAAGAEARSFPGAVLHEPPTITNRQGLPFKVFTAFWKYCAALPPPAPLPAPATLTAPAGKPRGVSIDSLELLPRIRWDRPMLNDWTVSAAGARAELEAFVNGSVEDYADGRDRPAVRGTSRLSAYLHFGQLTAAEIMARARRGNQPASGGAEAFVRQLYWRDFAHHLLYHFPHMPERALNASFDRFPWAESADGDGLLAAWQRGETGYPLVDAGMRELWATGYMHNRVRMNVASFLVKHLLIHWRAGQSWFWDTLVDADLANNAMGWQWAAGCGVDAAPYFRIFNPVLQGERFDPAADYIARWVPELSALPAKWRHKPAAASAAILREGGVRLGRDYPRPVVDHQEARASALAAFATLKARA
ncbi:MAG: deoxyribodipyrimidine photo-lyase [Pseudomonadota bacterium]